ncbi:MAG: hypothetical protein JXA03_16095 [Bacteroidales bacterium]|nr:hypothetical protein [Bacteroidales bacterium]
MKQKKKPKKGWESAFKEMNENGDDQLLISDVFEDENPVIGLKKMSDHSNQSPANDHKKKNNKTGS